jgi:hypothetical protein
MIFNLNFVKNNFRRILLFVAVLIAIFIVLFTLFFTRGTPPPVKNSPIVNEIINTGPVVSNGYSISYIGQDIYVMINKTPCMYYRNLAINQIKSETSSKINVIFTLGIGALSSPVSCTAGVTIN